MAGATLTSRGNHAEKPEEKLTPNSARAACGRFQNNRRASWGLPSPTSSTIKLYPRANERDLCSATTVALLLIQALSVRARSCSYLLRRKRSLGVPPNLMLQTRRLNFFTRIPRRPHKVVYCSLRARTYFPGESRARG